MDRYFISSFIATAAGIIAALGLFIWFAFAFAWAPWALLALGAFAVAWFYRLGLVITRAAAGTRAHHVNKPHERAGRP